MANGDEEREREYSFFCQYDACGERSPNLQELRVAIASVEVPVDRDGEGFIRCSAVYGASDGSSAKLGEVNLQSNIRVKLISTSTECKLYIGDEGVWHEGHDLLTGHDITPLPKWTEYDNKLFNEVYDFETQYLRYSDERDAVGGVGIDGDDPYVTTQALNEDTGDLRRLELNNGTILQYYTPNFSFSTLYEYSPYWPLSTSYIEQRDEDSASETEDFDTDDFDECRASSSPKRSLQIALSAKSSPVPVTKKPHII